MRFILGFIGAVFAGVLMIAFISNLATYLTNRPAPLPADEFHLPPKEVHFTSDGPFGYFDNRQLQRGFQVYSEVCSACHSLKLVSFRDLKDIGYDDAEVKAIAAQWKASKVPSINPDTGEATTRQPLPSDTFPPPFPNEVAARAVVVFFLLIATILGYLAYHQIWDEAKRAVRPTGPLDPENQAKSRRAKAKAGVAG
jgi:ubiquinol-cytochrome c reductase cytochrome c1 subunit